MAGSDGALDDATVAVIAHGLMTAMGIVSGSVRTLRAHWDELSKQPEQVLEIFERIECQAEFSAGILRELTRGYPAELFVGSDRVIHLP
jgi:hypothetical protein